MDKNSVFAPYHLTFSGRSTHTCALKGKVEVTQIFALKGRFEAAKVHIFAQSGT
jgi:hypothetical protein